MSKLIENLQEAEKIIKIADHMFYITFPLVKDKKLLLKIILQIKKSLIKCISCILQNEYLYKRITLYKNPKTNLEIFKTKSFKIYNISQSEIKLLLELFEIVEKYEKSQIEFIRNEKVIILSENSQIYFVTIEKTKEFLNLARNIIQKTKDKILKNLS